MSQHNYQYYRSLLSTDKPVIYALCEPGIRYVGQTTNLRKRVREHHQPANIARRTHHDCWMRSLVARSETANADELDQLEIMWITNCHILGYHLTNFGRGGQGNRDKHVSTQTKAKLSAAMKGNQNSLGITRSNETRRKVSEAAKLREAKKRTNNA